MAGTIHHIDPAGDARRRFILRNGVLGWGLSSGLLWVVAMQRWGGDAAPFWVYVAFAVVAFPAIGALWGALMWKLTGRRSLPTSSWGPRQAR
jgi:hypothetical protein